MPRKIDTIIIHCSATPSHQDIGADEIRNWHKAKGWKDIGYHFVVRRNGNVELGRQINEIGAHAKGHNKTSIGICMIGGVDANRKTKADANYTIAQWDALHLLVRSLLHNNIEIQTVIGHRDVSNKACPCFDVGAWAESLMEVQCVRSK